MRWTRTLVVVYINVALYALCFQFQRPIEPFLVSKLSEGSSNSGVAYGKLQSFFGAVQTIGSPLLGFALDRIGAKGGFLIVFVASAASYGLLSIATSMHVLYLSKVPAVLQHAFLVSQTLVAQETDETDRAHALGLLMTAYTFGATVGPAAGGLIGASGDYYLGARLAVAGSLLSAALTLLIPTSGKGQQISPDTKDVDVQKLAKPGMLAEFRAVLGNKTVAVVLTARFASSVSNALFQAAQPIILKDLYGMREAGMGGIMSASSLCNAVTGAFAVGPLTKYFGSGTLVTICLCLITAGYAVQVAIGPGSTVLSFLMVALPSSMPLMAPFVVASIAQTAAAFAMGTAFTAVSTLAVPNNLKGTLLGVEHGLFSFARVGVPSLGTYLLALGGIPAVCGICGFLTLSVAVGWSSNLARLTKISAPKAQ